MNTQEKIINILEKPINYRSFKMQSYRRDKTRPPYIVLFDLSAKRIAKKIKRIYDKRDKELIEKLQREDVETLVKKFGKYSPDSIKFVIEGFSLARNYILFNKLKI